MISLFRPVPNDNRRPELKFRLPKNSYKIYNNTLLLFNTLYRLPDNTLSLGSEII
jgi:hypothetical protein